MKFEIIYETEATKAGYLTPPPRKFISGRKPKLKKTETRSMDSPEPEDIGYKHRKYWGVLNKAEFLELLEHTAMVAERTKTMGALTLFGLQPAVAFRNERLHSTDSSNDAYVTPLPDVQRKEGWTERDFDRIEQTMWRMFA